MSEDTATEGTADPSGTDTQGQSVQSELDALIGEGQQRETDLAKNVKSVVSYVQDQQAEKFNERFRSDMDVAVKAIQEVVPEEAGKFLTADMIEGQLYKLAEDDASVKEAFLQRANKPEAWAKMQQQIVKDFSKRFEAVPDEGIKEDREAVIAAAKSQGKPKEDEEMSLKDLQALPKDQWHKLQEDHGVKPYGT